MCLMCLSGSLANGETQDGTKVDPHNLVNIKDYSLGGSRVSYMQLTLGGSWPEHDPLEFNPAHEGWIQSTGLHC